MIPDTAGKAPSCIKRLQLFLQVMQEQLYNFCDQLYQHAREVLQQAEFECVICKSRARKCVNQPKLYLQTHLPHVYDAACPICDRPSCETRPHQRQNANASAFADREIPGLCAQCGSSGPLQKCSKCLVASYCSKDCQVSHWPQHKRGCRRPAVATA